ncbi:MULTISPECIES: glyoxalase III HchA [Stenotrophomonas]|uniref:Protein deglycase HchA n=1 Tax=Stenotrophomonas maltophilia TaxID=40324 RepID=A0A3S0HW95_STEMA|nr:glyoxalase III HchA [Stenotrophomonas maltophilia]RTQ89108.1 protein deglycase HchA [Stenotrophomonas maltophilia]
MNTQEPSRHPSPDPAERDAFFPSPYSLSQFTSAKSNLSGADYPDARRDGRWKVLMIAADERYLPTANGHLFSTGNHPVETLLPMYHLDKAGFDIDVATLSGNAAKFEWWAFPREDTEIGGLYDRYEARFRKPLPLDEVVAGLDAASDYAAVFIPGGHGALIGLPQSRAVKAALHWAMAEQRHIITLCHGPAALLAAGVDEADGGSLFRGYRICAFPDAMDRQTPEIGYMPGQLPWFFGERLAQQGVQIVNDGIDGSVLQDRLLLTGDSPLAGNALGKLAARALLDALAGR